MLRTVLVLHGSYWGKISANMDSLVIFTALKCWSMLFLVLMCVITTILDPQTGSLTYLSTVVALCIIKQQSFYVRSPPQLAQLVVCSLLLVFCLWPHLILEQLWLEITLWVYETLSANTMEFSWLVFFIQLTQLWLLMEKLPLVALCDLAWATIKLFFHF